MLKSTPQQILTPKKSLVASVLLLASAAAMAASDCSNLKGCERKVCEIQHQLDIANDKGYHNKAAGLTSALQEANEHCTDKGLRDDILDDIADSKEDLAQYQADLKQATEDNDKDEMKKYQRKIDEENAELKESQAELKAFF